MRRCVIRLLVPIFVFLLNVSCGERIEVEIEYYKNGNKKAEYSVDDEVYYKAHQRLIMKMDL